MCPTKYLPQPYFKIDEDFNILAVSDRALEIFKPASDFLDLVDWESRSKAIQVLSRIDGGSRKECELIMQTTESPYALMDVSINWNQAEGHIICLEKDHRLAELERIVEKHRVRLAETNMELLEKKELVEKGLKEIKSLSSPFIKLTKSKALVALYGNLDGELILQNEKRILERAYSGRYTEILFDFNGVGNLTEDGVDAFIVLIKELQVMGMFPVVIGVKPHHAFYLNQHNVLLDIPFLHGLSNVLKTISQT